MMMLSRRVAGWILLLSLLMSVSPVRSAERVIEKEIVVPAALDKVWASWTTREGIQGFFAPEAVIEPRVGGAFHIHIDPLGAAGQKGADDMRFMALQPMKMLSFDWNAPPSLPEARTQRTFVVLRFEPVDAANTRVRLTHIGWGEGGEWDKAYGYFDKAWTGVLDNLKKRHESGPRDWTEWMNQLRKWHEEADKAAKKP